MKKILCWDCNEEIKVKVEIDEETRKGLPKDLQGNGYMICETCAKED